MGLEVATFISGLNANNPVGATDPKSQGDDHLRLIKSTLLNSFPNITGAMNASHTELNNLVGITGKTGSGNIVLSVSPTLTGTITGGTFSGNGSLLTALNASNLASGKVPAARLIAANIPSLDAAKITTGIFADARIPNLNASKITAGIFADARIPNLNASKITAGVLPLARGGTGQTTMDNLSEQVTLKWTIQADPGGIPLGSPGDVFAYF